MGDADGRVAVPGRALRGGLDNYTPIISTIVDEEALLLEGPSTVLCC